jgi:hypothetical protein
MTVTRSGEGGEAGIGDVASANWCVGTDAGTEVDCPADAPDDTDPEVDRCGKTHRFAPKAVLTAPLHVI